MEYKDLFKDWDGKSKPASYDWGEDVGRERFWENVGADDEVSDKSNLSNEY